MRRWALVEADFQREYNIDLVTELPRLSWRKFLVLLAGLSPQAVFRVAKDKPEPISDPDEVAARFRALAASIQARAG